jgi:hypothetical protein
VGSKFLRNVRCQMTSNPISIDVRTSNSTAELQYRETTVYKSPSPKCIGHSHASQNSPQATKLLIYKIILKPSLIQLWGTASTSNIEILERFQSKALRMIVDSPWYVPNMVIRRDLQIPTLKEEIRRYSSQYDACLSAHQNDLPELPDNRRLRRHLPNDLPTRFLV